MDFGFSFWCSTTIRNVATPKKTSLPDTVFGVSLFEAALRVGTIEPEIGQRSNERPDKLVELQELFSFRQGPQYSCADSPPPSPFCLIGCSQPFGFFGF